MFFQFKDAKINREYNLLSYILSCLTPVPILSIMPLILLHSSLGRSIAIIIVGLISLFLSDIIFSVGNTHIEMIDRGSDIPEFVEHDPNIPLLVKCLSITLISLSCLIFYIFF